MSWIDIGAITDIPLRGARIVKTELGCVAVFRTDDNEVFATSDRCPHKGGNTFNHINTHYSRPQAAIASRHPKPVCHIFCAIRDRKRYPPLRRRATSREDLVI